MNIKQTLLATAVHAALMAEAEAATGSGGNGSTPPAVVAGTIAATADGSTVATVAADPNAPPAAGSAAAALAAINTKTDYIKVGRKFHFKKDRKLGTKRPTIELNILKPTLEGVVNALSDEKVRDYVLEILEEQCYKAARDQVGDDSKPVNKQEELDMNKITLAYLASMPKAERTGGGISKETWEEFAEDYAAVMPGRTSFTAEQIANAVKIFVGRFQAVKTQKKIVAFLQTQLALWFNNTTNQEEFQEVYDFLDQKAVTLLAADEASLLANLGG